MKRWSIFGAAKAPEPKAAPPHAQAPRGFEWSAMFRIRKKPAEWRRARAEAEEKTSV
jgi:hypothetical protein